MFVGCKTYHARHHALPTRRLLTVYLWVDESLLEEWATRQDYLCRDLQYIAKSSFESACNISTTSCLPCHATNHYRRPWPWKLPKTSPDRTKRIPADVTRLRSHGSKYACCFYLICEPTVDGWSLALPGLRIVDWSLRSYYEVFYFDVAPKIIALYYVIEY